MKNSESMQQHPESSKQKLLALSLAVIMHILLIAFLWIGIDWKKTSSPNFVAEVWQVPQPEATKPIPQSTPEKISNLAALKTVSPNTSETKPDIVIEKIQKARTEKTDEQKVKQELEKKQKTEKEYAEQKKREAQADHLIREQLRQQQIARLKNIAQQSTNQNAATSSINKAEEDAYSGAIVSKVKSNIIYTHANTITGNPKAHFRIEQLPTGEVIRVIKIESSGIFEYDQAIERAIYKSSPLPKRADGSVAKTIDASFTPKD